MTRILLSSLLVFLLSLGVQLTTSSSKSQTGDDEQGIVFYAGDLYTNVIDNPGLYWMSEDGSSKKLIVGQNELLQGSNSIFVSELQISTDGAKVAYNTQGNNDGILIYDLHLHEISELTTTGFSPSWSADNQQIAYIDVVSAAPQPLLYEIRIINVISRKERSVLSSSDIILEPELNTRYFWDVSWSPDGEELVVGVYLTPGLVKIDKNLREIQEAGPTLLIVDLNDGNVQKILNDNILGYRGFWSDENIVYFICYTSAIERPKQICRVNLDTFETTVIGNFQDVIPKNEWVIDFNVLLDEKLVFTRSYWDVNGPGGDLYVFDLKTNFLINLDSGGSAMNMFPRWISSTALP